MGQNCYGSQRGFDKILKKMRKNCRYSNKNVRAKKNSSAKIYFDMYLVYAYFMIFHSHASLRHTGHRQQIPEISPYLAVNGTQSSTSPPQHRADPKSLFFGKTHIPK